MRMDRSYEASVRRGRLVLDVPTDLPEGTGLDLEVVAAASPSPATRTRVEALEQLIELFEGHDVRAEIAELKRQDEGF